ncbi:hypothetical protein ABT187_42210 [Streptomyces sp. NPDC001817]|uniref:hypothetical protein n=1 Tax=Streptomyces sp. NPDC001817 TaxID=3154398 RepID=UPI00331A0964
MRHDPVPVRRNHRADVQAWVRDACLLCLNGCGLEVTVRDGRMVVVRGRAEDRGQPRSARSEGGCTAGRGSSTAVSPHRWSAKPDVWSRRTGTRRWDGWWCAHARCWRPSVR